MFDALLPRPVRADPAAGTYVLNDLPPQVSTTLAIDPKTVPTPEGFHITIAPSGVTTIAADQAGAYYAELALHQLLGPQAFRAANIHKGPWKLPCGRIEDHPRFPWRGCLLDVARHFMPKAGVLRFIDLLATHRLNVLHLHLTDDQGWRLEVPEYPRLTEIASWREGSWTGRPPDGTKGHDGRPHGGFYTTEDLREIVAYAAARHVTVVPEVDVPGHTQAAIAAYPELGVNGTPLPVLTRWGISENVLNMSNETVKFFEQIFTHVASIFPSPVICVGGDEVPTTQWANDPTTRHRMAELGLPTPAHLHGWFVTRMTTHLSRLGKRALTWDDVLDTGTPPQNTIIANWRNEQTGITAATSGHDVVMCPEQHTYLDHRQSDHPDEPIPVGYRTTLADVYSYNPIPPDLPPAAHPRILGAQAQVWTEHLDTPRRVDYATFPRLAAFAEVVWSPHQHPHSPHNFEHRLTHHHLPRLDAQGVEYRPPTGPHPWQTRPNIPGHIRQRQR